MKVEMEVIGVVRGAPSKMGDDFWGGVRSVIELKEGVLDASSTLGLDEFSHVEVVFVLDRVSRDDVVRGARRPRNNPDWPLTGILAQRAKARPNRIGVSRARIRRVDGLRIEVEGLDAIDGTPVLDVKPLMREFLPTGAVLQPPWATELMRDYYADGRDQP